MKVQYILSQAIYESLQDSQFQFPVNGGYNEVALNILNGILDLWRDRIPFSKEYTFNNVNELTDTNFISVTNVNYILSNVQQPLRSVGLDQFNNMQNVIGLTGTPQIYYWDELAQTIQVYPLPANPSYQFAVWGRTATDPVAADDDVPNNVPRFMVEALIFELAHRLCIRYGRVWTADKEGKRQEMITFLDNKNSTDLSAPIMSVFGRPNGGVPGYPWLWAISGGH